MELQTAFETRRSIRHYDAEKKVTKEQVETLIITVYYPRTRLQNSVKNVCRNSIRKIQQVQAR